MRVLALIALLVLSACEDPIREDICNARVANATCIPAQHARYPTVEFYAKGQHFFGLGAVQVLAGDSLNRLDLKVQGYFKGTVTAYSEDCGLDVRARYDGHAQVALPLTGVAKESCGIALGLAPELPGESNQDVVIHSLEGYLLVNVVQTGESWDDRWDRLSMNAERALVLTPQDPALQSHMVLQGCGQVIDEDLTLSADGSYELQASRLRPAKPRVCTFFGLLTPDNTFFSWTIAFYSSRYNKPAIPELRDQGGILTIQADPNATAIGLDGQWKVGNRAEFGWDSTKGHVLRALTTAGRTVVGFYEPNKGWLWKR